MNETPRSEMRSDPLMMSVLKSRFEAIVREMTLVVMRASRSAVIKNARDFSCAILTFDHRIVSTENALPIHVASMDLVTRPITGWVPCAKAAEAAKARVARARPRGRVCMKCLLYVGQ